MTQPLNQNNMTAVETLLDWLGKNHYYIGNDLLEKVEELKEMEKEIIRTAYLDGMDGEYNTSEQYYNETFKSE
jgi:hypothetical protein